VRYTPEGKRLAPDGLFKFQLDGEPPLLHYVEVDMGTARYEKMAERYRHYHAYCRSHRGQGVFRVLTVATTWSRLEGLRTAAAGVGVHPRTKLPWAGFLFALLSDFRLEEPEAVLCDPLFRYAVGTKTVALLSPVPTTLS
jgi:hypothetical protein